MLRLEAYTTYEDLDNHSQVVMVRSSRCTYRILIERDAIELEGPGVYLELEEPTSLLALTKAAEALALITAALFEKGELEDD